MTNYFVKSHVNIAHGWFTSVLSVNPLWMLLTFQLLRSSKYYPRTNMTIYNKNSSVFTPNIYIIYLNEVFYWLRRSSVLFWDDKELWIHPWSRKTLLWVLCLIPINDIKYAYLRYYYIYFVFCLCNHNLSCQPHVVFFSLCLSLC